MRASAKRKRSLGRDEQVAMVWTVLLYQKNEILPATLTTRKKGEEDTVGGTSGEQREEYSSLNVGLNLDLKRVCAKMSPWLQL